MWIVTGPFESDDLSFTKTKLLKTGKTYGIGRKNQPLLVKSKKVSGNHCEIIVGSVSSEDVHNPESRPTLTIVHQRDKAMRLARHGHDHVVNPNKPMELEDGDALSIVTGLVLSFKWIPICCYSPHLRGKSIPLDTCAALGISILYAPSPQVTHHIIPTYTTNAPIASSLISAAQFVKQEWFTDLLNTGDALENTFVLPPISKHRPSFSPALNPSQKVFKVWEPNEERLNMFAEYRFLVFGEKTRDVESDLRELIKRGGGFLETFDVAGGVSKLHKALTRGQAKEGQQLVIVADTRATKAVIGSDEWKKLVEEVDSFGLHITHPDTLVQAVIEVETSLLTETQQNSLETEDSLPSCVMNSVPDEPSIQPEESAPPRRRLLRRATSRQPSLEPTPQPVMEPEPKNESPKPRRLLSRRAKTVEPSAEGAESNPMDVDKLVEEPTPIVPPTPNRPRLKRRLGVISTAPEPSQPPPRSSSRLPDLPPTEDAEPPLKKFKALFDASNPGQSGSGSFDEMLESEDLISQTQTQTQGFVRRPATGSSLAVLREEEEEETLPPKQEALLRGRKRTLSSLSEDIEMQDSEGRAPPSAKRQAVDNVNAVKRAPKSGANEAPSNNKEKKSGAPVGKPDTDADFLKAVASTKKGKRAEDIFDREFNNLKISKPEAERQEPEEEWRLISDFGDDAGLRGNFMVVLEMELPKKSDIRRSTRPDASSEWADKPNFKKFKKKFQGIRAPFIELVVPGVEDYGEDWEVKKTSQTHHTPGKAGSSIKRENHFGSFSLPNASNEIIIDDDDDENEPPRLGKTKSTRSNTRATSRESSRAPSRTISKPTSRAGSLPRTKRTMSKVPSKTTLFFDSDDDIQEVDETFDAKSTDLEESQTLRSSNHFSKAASSLGKRAAAVETKAVIVDDDDDDGVVFKGFGGRK